MTFSYEKKGNKWIVLENGKPIKHFEHYRLATYWVFSQGHCVACGELMDFCECWKN